MSNSTAYATSSWHTCTAESDTVPTRMNAVICGVRSRNRVSSPCDSIATPGQNVSSNRKNTLRRAMMRLRWAKAHVRTHSACRPSASELNEHVLELRLLDPAVAHQHGLLLQPAQELREPLVDGIHRTVDVIPAHLHLEHAGHVVELCRHARVQAKGDDLADPNAALELVRAALGQNAAALDERDHVAQL